MTVLSPWVDYLPLDRGCSSEEEGASGLVFTCMCAYMRRGGGCKHARGCKQAAGPNEVSGGWIRQRSAANPHTVRALFQTDQLTSSSPYDSSPSLNTPKINAKTFKTKRRKWGLLKELRA